MILRKLADDMLETMYAAPGIVLAAVQVGALDRVIVMDLGDKDGVVCETEEEAEEMEALERTLLARLGIPDPYAA